MKYCPFCGEVVKNENGVKTILLKCKQCNKNMNISENERILYCPYCGCKEMIIENDSVKTASIHANAYRDVELGKQQTVLKMKQMDIDEKNRTETVGYRRKKSGFFLMLGSVLFFILAVQYSWLFPVGSEMFITVLCIMIFIAGRRLWKKKKMDDK